MHGATKICLGDKAPRIDVKREELLPRRRLYGGDRTFCLALSRDGGRAFTGREDGTLFSLPLATGGRIKKRNLNASIERILVADGEKVVALTGDGSIYVLDGHELQVVVSQHGIHTRGIFAGTFASFGRVLVTGGLDGWVRSWEFPSLAPISGIKVPRHGVLSLAAMKQPEGELLIAGNVNGNLVTIDLSGLAVVAYHKAHDGPVFSVKAMPGGHGAAFTHLSTGSDGRVAGWNVGRVDPALEIHSGQAKLLDLLPIYTNDGHLALWTASTDGSIGVWSIVPGPAASHPEPLGCFQVHDRAVEQLVFCERSGRLFSIASDGSMQRMIVAI